MHTFRGIGVETWVYLATDCQMETEVERTQVRFEFGHMTSSLNLCVSAPMLEQFVTAAATALREWRERFPPAATGPARVRQAEVADPDPLSRTADRETAADRSVPAATNGAR